MRVSKYPQTPQCAPSSMTASKQRLGTLVGVQHKAASAHENVGTKKIQEAKRRDDSLSANTPVPVVRVSRKMRGGSQSRLVEAIDGNHYIAKFVNNPQGARTLANEWISQRILTHLGIATPSMRMLDFSTELVQANPDLAMLYGDRVVPVASGVHLGSMFPGNPSETAVYDFLPDRMLKEVTNLSDFVGALVVDRWVANLDVRQAIFLRARPRDWAPRVAAHGSKRGLIALMIDHGLSFCGSRWEFADTGGSGLFGNPLVYQTASRGGALKGWIERIRYFPEQIISQALREIPDEWIEGRRIELEALAEKLLARRAFVGNSVEQALRAIAA